MCGNETKERDVAKCCVLVLVLALVMSTSARNVPSDAALKDQKNFTTYGGIGGHSGIGTVASVAASVVAAVVLILELNTHPYSCMHTCIWLLPVSFDYPSLWFSSGFVMFVFLINRPSMLALLPLESKLNVL